MSRARGVSPAARPGRGDHGGGRGAGAGVAPGRASYSSPTSRPAPSPRRSPGCRSSWAGPRTRRHPTRASCGSRPERSPGRATAAGSRSVSAGDSGAAILWWRGSAGVPSARRWRTSAAPPRWRCPARRAAGGRVTAELDPDELRAGRPADRCGAGGGGGAASTAGGGPFRRRGVRGAAGEPPDHQRGGDHPRAARPARIGASSRRRIRPPWARSIARSAARGVAWRYGALSLAPTSTDSGSAVGRVRVLRRYRLESSASGRTGVIATVGESHGWCEAAMWCCWEAASIPPGPSCRSPPGSCRSWIFCSTGWPAARSAWAKARRVIRCRCPTWSRPCARASGSGGWKAAGSFRPAEPGAYYLVSGRDTLGAISANLDPREIAARAGADAQVRRLWNGARRWSPLPERGRRRLRRRARGATCVARCSGSPLLLGLGETALASGRWRAAGEAQAGDGRLRALPATIELAERLPPRGTTLAAGRARRLQRRRAGRVAGRAVAASGCCW